jgi:hypothetical protein
MHDAPYCKVIQLANARQGPQSNPLENHAGFFAVASSPIPRTGSRKLIQQRLADLDKGRSSGMFRIRGHNRFALVSSLTDFGE